MSRGPFRLAGPGSKLDSALCEWLRMPVRVAALCLALLAACAKPPAPCEDGSQESCPGTGTPPPDSCNSREEALTDPACRLQLGQARTPYISFAGDQDWYLLQLPSPLSARSLIHLTAGYGAPNTAVNLTVALLREDGQVSLARKRDPAGPLEHALRDAVPVVRPGTGQPSDALDGIVEGG